MAALESAGSEVRYMPVDVRDSGALRGVLEEVRRGWGPITGIVHGAGVLADKLIADKTDEQFDRVLTTKVGGLRTLLAATEEDPLDTIVLFSSVAAVFGNAGQSDYAMANEVLGQVACAERARRPDCLVRSIAWGPWHGGMVTPALAALMGLGAGFAWSKAPRRPAVVAVAVAIALVGVPAKRHARGVEAPAAAPDDHVEIDPLATQHLPQAERRGALHAARADHERDALLVGAHAG